MANSQDSSDFREEATVDTAPGTSGYFTNAINPRQLSKDKGAKEIYYNVRSSDDNTVTLQFQLDGETTWYDHSFTSANVVKKIVENRAGVRWRAGVKSSADYLDGSVTFGFNW